MIPLGIEPVDAEARVRGCAPRSAHSGQKGTTQP